MATEPTIFTQTIDPKLGRHIARLRELCDRSPFRVVRELSETQLRLLATGQNLPPRKARGGTVETSAQVIDWLENALPQAARTDAIRYAELVRLLPKTLWGKRAAGVLENAMREAIERAFEHTTAIRQPGATVTPLEVELVGVPPAQFQVTA